MEPILRPGDVPKGSPWIGKVFYAAFLLVSGFMIGSYIAYRGLQPDPGITVLYEPQGTTDSALLGALGTLLFGPIGGAVGQELAKQSGPRWIIPVKIQPQIVGEMAGVSYLWILPGNRKQGPFQPKPYPAH